LAEEFLESHSGCHICSSFGHKSKSSVGAASPVNQRNLPLLRSWENFFGRGLQIFRAYGAAGRRREIEMSRRAGNMTI